MEIVYGAYSKMLESLANCLNKLFEVLVLCSIKEFIFILEANRTIIKILADSYPLNQLYVLVGALAGHEGQI